ncbi:MAG: hypothetical protein LBP28_01945 [Coriobacteriales bacterium]|jgi:hypothetical protein|nr:hypothetical protein [Coriobacteriales bacterium]
MNKLFAVCGGGLLGGCGAALVAGGAWVCAAALLAGGARSCAAGRTVVPLAASGD